MSIFDMSGLVEGIAVSLMGKLGLTPDLLRQHIGAFVAEIAEMKADRAGFKAAFRKEIPELHRRLDTIEGLLRDVLAARDAVPVPAVPAITHEEAEHERHNGHG